MDVLDEILFKFGNTGRRGFGMKHAATSVQLQQRVLKVDPS